MKVTLTTGELGKQETIQTRTLRSGFATEAEAVKWANDNYGSCRCAFSATKQMHVVSVVNDDGSQIDSNLPF